MHKTPAAWYVYEVRWEFIVGYEATTPRLVEAVSPDQAIVIAVRLVERELGLSQNHFGNLNRIKRWFYNPTATRVSEQPVLRLPRRPVWQQLKLGLQG